MHTISVIGVDSVGYQVNYFSQNGFASPVGLLALLQIPEKQIIRFSKTGFDNGLVDQVERYDLAEMAEQIGNAINADVKGEGQFGSNGQKNGCDQ